VRKATSQPDEFAAAVREALADHRRKRVWVGFSGGADSTALLLAAARVVRTMPETDLTALHVNHGLNAQANAWQAHCARICEAQDVAFVCDRVVVAEQGNLEQNARDARYAAFRARVRPGERLLMAHHQDDQAATLLMRLFQGRGFMAMRKRGRLGEGEFVRPLLEFSRTALCDYVEAAGVEWIEDASNFDEGFDRNFIRHRISGLIAERWSGWQSSVLRVARHQQGISDALAHSLADVPDQFSLTRLPATQDARRIWLRHYLAARGVHNVSDAALGSFLTDLQAGQAARLDLTLSSDCQAVLRLYKDQVYFDWVTTDGQEQLHAAVLFQSESNAEPARFTPGDVIALGWGRLRLELVANAGLPGLSFAYSPSLHVRACGRHERLQTGPEQFSDVTDLLRKAGVPPWRRAHYPVVCDATGPLCIPDVCTAWRPNSAEPLQRARAYISHD
jgi:tRNA(Ile)-lysidine synthase